LSPENKTGQSAKRFALIFAGGDLCCEIHAAIFADHANGVSGYVAILTGYIAIFQAWRRRFVVWKA